MGFRNSEELIAGILATAPSGERVVISSSVLNSVQFFTGDAAEAGPGRVYVESLPDFNALTVALQAPLSTADPDAPRPGIRASVDRTTAIGSVNIRASGEIELESASVQVFGGISAEGGITLPAGQRIERGPIASLPLLAGWTAFGGGYQPPGYVELPDHYGALVGVIGGGTATHGTIIASVGASVRPALAHTFVATGNGGDAVQLALATNGNIVLQSPPAGLAWISFGGSCTWPIAGF